MKNIINKFIRLNIGLILCAISIIMSLQSNLGLSPWDVFHQGISKMTGITLGQANIIVGIIVVIITIFLKMEIGLGTLGNVILIGIFMDLIVYAKLIPKSTNLFSGLIMLIASLFIMAMGTYLYISSEIGCGPRDGLMVVLVRITQKSVGIVRFVIESSVLIVGYILGGTVGVGTVITTFGLAYCTGLVFRIFKFDVGKVKHKSIRDSFLTIGKILRKTKNNNAQQQTANTK